MYLLKKNSGKWFGLILLISVMFLDGFSNLYGQIGLHGGRGLVRVQDALLVQKGDLYLGGFGSAFFKKGGSGGLAKDYHFSVNATYGLANSVELTAQFVAYQDDQQHIWGPFGDTEIGLKMRIPLGERSIIGMSVQNQLIIPTGVNHNLPYEPFTSDNLSWKPGANLSLDLTDVIYFPLKFYFNVGLIDRNLSDGFFAADIDQYYLGGGLKFSVKNVIFFWEYYTEQFSNRKDILFSENYQVSTQGFVFLGPYNLIFTLANDINLMKPSDLTFFKSKKMADWKIWLGIAKYIPLRGYVNEYAEKRRREKEREEDLKKQQMIRQKRLSAEEELKQMRELLKKQENKKKKKKK